MTVIQSLSDLELLRESVDIEVKLAAGRDGQGALPEDFWPTYSAFANTQGGIVVLGVREKSGQFSVEGIANIAKVRKDLFDALNNRQKVSANLLNDASVREIVIEGKTILSTEHPVDLSKTLQHLTHDGMLESTGGRGAIYHLPGETIPTPDDVFGSPPRISVPSSSNLDLSSSNLDLSSSNLDNKRDANGCLMADQLPLTIIDNLTVLSPDLLTGLETIATIPRAKGKVERDVLITIILQLCAKHFVTLRCLASLVHRKPETLRNQYLTPLVRERKLTLAFPTTPTHERQAYCTSSER